MASGRKQPGLPARGQGRQQPVELARAGRPVFEATSSTSRPKAEVAPPQSFRNRPRRRIRAELPAKALTEWPRSDDDLIDPERPDGGGRSGSARARGQASVRLLQGDWPSGLALLQWRLHVRRACHRLPKAWPPGTPTASQP